MKRIAIITLLFILGVIGSTVAQGGTIYVPDPGQSFGPIRIGEFVPFVWDASCTSEGLYTTYYLFRLGMEMVVYNSGQKSSSDRIGAIFVSRDPWFSGSIPLTRTKCSNMAGQDMSKSFHYKLPQSITYVSNKGVPLNATIDQVLGAHGTPKKVQNYVNSSKVGSIGYCGISFGFDEAGKVNWIAVTSKESSPFTDLC
jgi:hypothetical protein